MPTICNFIKLATNFRKNFEILPHAVMKSKPLQNQFTLKIGFFSMRNYKKSVWYSRIVTYTFRYPFVMFHFIALSENFEFLFH